MMTRLGHDFPIRLPTADKSLHTDRPHRIAMMRHRQRRSARHRGHSPRGLPRAM